MRNKTTKSVGVGTGSDIDEFSVYDFMCLFVAISAMKKRKNFNKDDLLEFIYDCQNNKKYENLLNDFKIWDNGLYLNSIGYLQVIEKLGDEKILRVYSSMIDVIVDIEKNLPMEELINSRMDKFEEMVTFMIEYDQYKKCNCDEFEKIDFKKLFVRKKVK